MDAPPPFFESWFIWKEPLLVAALAATLCAFVGVFIVLRRMVFVSAALSQMSGVGVATAFLLASFVRVDPHEAPWYLNPILLAFLFATVGAALFSHQLARRRLATETVIAIGYLVAAAAVILILSSPHVAQEEHEVKDLLYGNAVAVPPGTLEIMAVTAACVLLIHALFFKDFVFVSFDGETARTLGYRTGLWDLLLFETFAVTSSVATRSIGALPAFGFMVLPPAAALLLGRRLWQVFALSVGFALLATGLGYYVSWPLSLPTGATMVVIAGLFLVPGLINLRRGR
jgi:zinc transport system permease protein